MSELIIRPDSQLPAAIDELVDFIIITDEQTKACKAKVRAATKTEQAEHMVDASIEAGQYVGEINLLAQAKLGELLAATKPVYVQMSSQTGTNLKPKSVDDGSSPGGEIGLSIRSIPDQTVEELITVKEAAKILGIKERSFYNRLKSGKPFPKPVYSVSRFIRFKREDVLKYKEEM